MTYVNKNNQVWFRTVVQGQAHDVLIDGADPQTFEELSAGWAKDASSVYWRWWKVADAAPDLVVLDENYSKDSRRVFWCHRIVIGAEPSRFRVLNQNFAEDAKQVFWNGETVVGADPESFVALSWTMGKDQQNIYFMREPLAETCSEALVMDVASFEVLNSFYSRDKNHIYCTHYDYDCYSTELVAAEYASFEVVGGAFARDAHFLFNHGQIEKIHGAPANFALIGSYFARDEQHIYMTCYGGKHTDAVFLSRVEQADPASFAIVNDAYARDCQRVFGYMFDSGDCPWWGIQLVEGADPQNFDFAVQLIDWNAIRSKEAGNRSQPNEISVDRFAKTSTVAARRSRAGEWGPVETRSRWGEGCRPSWTLTEAEEEQRSHKESTLPTSAADDTSDDDILF